jgi:hypothetical protein
VVKVNRNWLMAKSAKQGDLDISLSVDKQSILARQPPPAWRCIVLGCALGGLMRALQRAVMISGSHGLAHTTY